LYQNIYGYPKGQKPSSYSAGSWIKPPDENYPLIAPKPYVGTRIGTGFINRDGARIAKEDWEHHRKDPDYTTVKAYDNSEVCVSVEWVGKVENIKNSYPDMWKVFRLNVLNYNELGKTVVDPVEDGKWFPDQAKAIAAYEKFLAGWTKSHWGEDGKLVEEDNNLTPPPPPPPPNPDAPDSDLRHIKGFEDDDTGVW